MQNDVTISLAQILWIIGGITALASFLSWVMKPLKKLDNHETRISALETTADERHKTDVLMMKAMNAIVNHTIDGNNTEELKSVRTEFQSEIIKHHL